MIVGKALVLLHRFRKKRKIFIPIVSISWIDRCFQPFTVLFNLDEKTLILYFR